MLRRTLESQLFGVTASNPVVLFLVTAMLTVVAFSACAVPARRATKIDPLVALND
jgi:ABC-type lipoprotein release transport system permease subunit